MIKLLKKIIFPAEEESEFQLPKFDISNAKTEEDYWNAAWQVHKCLIADQFVQSSQLKDQISSE